MIPAQVEVDDFRYDPVTPDSIDVGRLQLLFEFLFVPYGLNQHADMEIESEKVTEIFSVRAAFVQYLLPFADSRSRPLRRDRQGKIFDNIL